VTENCFFFLSGSGESIDPSELPFDSICLGRGAFETMLFTRGKPVLLREHEERLAASCVSLSIAARPQIAAIMRALVRHLAEEASLRTRVRLSVFAGVPSNLPAAVVSVSEAPPPPPAVSLGISSVLRSPSDPTAMHKSAAYLQNLLIRKAALERGDYDDLIVDTQGNVAETSTANIFLFCAGKLVTPSLACILPGIVRNWVLSASHSLGITVLEQPVARDELAACTSAFVTNSIIGLVPISAIAGRPLVPASSVPEFSALSSSYAALLQESA